MGISRGQAGSGGGRNGHVYSGFGPRTPRCPICRRPTQPSCAEHPEYLSENFHRRAKALLDSGTLTAYQAHKLRMTLKKIEGGGAV